MMTITSLVLIVYMNASYASEYQRNQAVPVKNVLFGKVLSVRKISEHELIQDKENGWNTFGGALIGGVIGNQFGDGSGQFAATILGSIIGANIAKGNPKKNKVKVINLIELMLRIDDGKEYMVVQDYDSKMQFNIGDAIRLIYLENGTVRVDKQY